MTAADEMNTLKRGTRITSYFATGHIVPAIIVRRVSDMPDWYVIRYADEHGGMQSCHRSQITVTDNRDAR